MDQKISHKTRIRNIQTLKNTNKLTSKDVTELIGIAFELCDVIEEIRNATNIYLEDK